MAPRTPTLHSLVVAEPSSLTGLLEFKHFYWKCCHVGLPELRCVQLIKIFLIRLVVTLKLSCLVMRKCGIPDDARRLAFLLRNGRMFLALRKKRMVLVLTASVPVGCHRDDIFINILVTIEPVKERQP